MSDNLNNNFLLLQKIQEGFEKLSKTIESMGGRGASSGNSERESLKAELLREIGVNPEELQQKKEYETWKKHRETFAKERSEMLLRMKEEREQQKVKPQEQEENKKRRWIR